MINGLLLYNALTGCTPQFELPDFDLYNTDGSYAMTSNEYFNDEELRIDSPEYGKCGKPILFNMWREYCGPCLVEMPDLDEFNKKSVEVVGLMPFNDVENTDVSGLVNAVNEALEIDYNHYLISSDDYASIADQLKKDCDLDANYIPGQALFSGYGKIIECGNFSFYGWEPEDIMNEDWACHKGYKE